ncbi:hypothetical protein [Clostridium beijerinckii]|uniref:hypothetical protein n=1 Tax=Clostridium beijerinckii TaxID=1520 RepID=UPI00156F2F44|nr:hypothetical protein [Clostridium beijerinckii]NRU52474.1 hypothetical protein [Clostridium beijerinckii]NYC69081.1 hypothetical protein [Clostridium beijerinckii]NYC91667.1 hypothetical protein [Clostridium beijerinckii]NYC91675.1 hypothetical protein [Clostridium beijerinckii]
MNEREEKLAIYNKIMKDNIGLIKDMFPSPRYIIDYDESEDYIGGEKLVIFDYKNVSKYGDPKKYLFGISFYKCDVGEYEEIIKRSLFQFILMVKRDKRAINKNDVKKDKYKSIGYFITETTLFDENDMVELLDYMYALGKYDGICESKENMNKVFNNIFKEGTEINEQRYITE